MNRLRSEGTVGLLGALLLMSFAFATGSAPAAETSKIFRACAAVVDITPTNFPVIVNAMFEERTAERANDPLHARCLALDDGNERILIAVVDSCMLPRELIDQAKSIVAQTTGIPTARMLVSATHTHSAPSAMGCLGSRVDPVYARFLPGRIAEGMKLAVQNLAPARIGWGVNDDDRHTFCRRWIRRPDRMLTDPFGDQNVRANMHPGHDSPDAIGPSGPVDPALSLLSVQTMDGRPVALLANYSMHYYESPLLSADYYGLFATKIARLIGAEGGNGPFVGIMSQGTSGDQMWMDYSAPRQQIGLDAYAQAMAESAFQAYRQIEYQDWVPLTMAETKFTLGFRLPDEPRLAWARALAAKTGDRPPRGMAEIYAREAIYLHERPTAELIVQAIRIGDLGIVAIPNEVYAITGLKIKAQSPCALTFAIELANGSEGYIPPPEQHALGGYTTWPARTAGLETNAEPRIVEESLRLLEQVTHRPRRKLVDAHGVYAAAVLAAKPVSYWRLNEFSGPAAIDATSHEVSAAYEGNVAHFLEGPQSPAFSQTQINRAPHFAGGHLNAGRPLANQAYTVELWFWNGLPADARAITGELVSLGNARDRLFIDGTNGAPGRIVFSVGERSRLASTAAVPTRTWNHLALVRQAAQVAVYLNGSLVIDGDASPAPAVPGETWTVAGRAARPFSFEGKLDEIAAYDYPLTAQEVSRHFQLAGMNAERAGATPIVPQPDPAPPFARMSSVAKSPAESMAVLHVAEGFNIELVAAEPLVTSPVAIDWGPDGKLWVVEMGDYPYGTDGKMKPGGRVRFLEDTDGDGKMDKSTIFLEGVNFPNGIISWRQGVIVTAAPDIFYAEDTNGDGKADKREVLFTGFKEGNLQLRINGLRWGLDNWLHCANGWSGGQPRSVQTGVQVDLNGRDLRIQPDSGQIEVESGQSEFGRNPNDWGDWFGCDNSYPVFHFVLEDRYMRRNPYVAAPESKRQLYLPANPKVYPRSREQKRYHSFEHASHFTSACSTDFYRDELLFPRGPDEHIFTCEPVHNLVQHLLMRPEGVSFTVRRAESEERIDFLASEDPWFRPVMARTGPDGALWIVDMYRYMIEHPDWLPPEGKKELEPFYRAGEDRGRIYRITSKLRPARPDPRATWRLDRLTSAELVAQLESPNGWRRDKAGQMLIWRGDKSVSPDLEKLVKSSPKPLARMHSLAALDGLGNLRPATLELALRDESPAVRRQALRWTDSRSRTSRPLLVGMAKLVSDPDAKVRLQLACSLGEWEEEAAGQALSELAVHDANDSFIGAAVMSSAPHHVQALVTAAVQRPDLAAETLTGPLLRLCLGLNRRDLLAQLLARAVDSEPERVDATQLKLFADFLDDLARRNSSVDRLSAEGQDILAQQLTHLDRLFGIARRLAPDTSQPLGLRLAATRLLGRDKLELPEDLLLLGSLLSSRTPGEVQRAASHAIARSSGAEVPRILLQGWSAALPEIRAAMVDELLGREAWALDLLASVKRGEIAPLEIGVVQRDRLFKHRSENVRALAERIFEAAANGDRQQVIEEFRPALSLKGDASRGREIFARTCSVCHRLEEVGREIGPNLNSVRGHPKEKLLTSILDPSREVEPRYLAYACTLMGGEELYGLIGSETGNGIGLKMADGSERTILRSEIESLQSSKVSLMPDGLEAGLSVQAMADLIDFLRAAPGVE